jgi:hypothetical protein
MRVSGEQEDDKVNGIPSRNPRTDRNLAWLSIIAQKRNGLRPRERVSRHLFWGKSEILHDNINPFVGYWRKVGRIRSHLFVSSIAAQVRRFVTILQHRHISELTPCKGRPTNGAQERAGRPGEAEVEA